MSPAARQDHGARSAIGWQAMLLVFVGGMLGAPARYLAEAQLPGGDAGFPVPTFVVNVLGAFALGVLMESLVLAGPDDGVRKQLRLCVGTGFLGAFTTYSSFAVEIDLLSRADQLGVAAAYAGASLAAGLAAVALGIGTAHAVRRTTGRSR